MRFRVLYQWLLFIIMGFSIACSPEPEPVFTPPPAKEPPSDINGPTDLALWNRLDGNVMGYQYITMKDGEIVNERAGGLAKNIENGQDEMTTEHQMHVASVSKFITTIAVLQQLEKYNIDVEESIDPYLPKEWIRGNGIEDVTFLRLISQTAGLNKVGQQLFAANRYDSLSSFIAAGSAPNLTPRYSNTHHALFRVILPILVDSMTIDSDNESDMFTRTEYQRIVREELLEPIGIDGALIFNSFNRALAYGGPNDSGAGYGDNLDFSSVGGGYGWHISSHDLAVLWSKVWYTEEVISESSRQILTSWYAGLYETRFSPQRQYYTKDGLWEWANPGKYHRCVAVHFPGGYDLIIFVNSDFGTIRDFAWTLYDELVEGSGA